MSYKTLALAACLILPLGGTAFAQTGTTGSPGAGPTAGGTMNSGGTTGTTGSTGGTMSGSAGT
ncbi:hypothetical protein FV219_25665, partial [Methylobacterium sp. WL122]